MWTKVNAEHTDAAARARWAKEEFDWGIWGVPESELDVLGDVAGKDVVELGCGTAYVSAWLARRGARPVGVDMTPAQLATARRLQRENGLEFPLVEAERRTCRFPTRRSTSSSPSTAPRSGCDPYRWIPEAARLLRPGGELVFLATATLADALLARRRTAGRRAAPAAAVRHAPLRVAGRRGDRVPPRARRLDPPAARERLRDRGARSSCRRPAPRRRTSYYDFVTAEWARRWPAEEIWAARKRDMSAPPAPPLVLASTSPQRRAILEQLRIPFEVVAPGYEEPATTRSSMRPERRARSSGGEPAGARRRHRSSSATAGCSASPASPARPRRCWSALGGGHTRSSRASASARPRWEEVGSEVDTGHVQAL